MDNSMEILSLSFNQDYECFVCGCTDGFRIFNSNPLKQIQSEILCGGVGVVEMLYRCNYVALVGGGPSPAFPKNKVIVWDYSLKKAVIELEMKQEVLAIRLRRDRIVVVLKSSVHVFSFSDIPTELAQLPSRSNLRGLCAISSSSETPFLAFPSNNGPGFIEVYDLAKEDEFKRRLQISAHSHELNAIAFNLYGTMIASASEKGTLVRVFDAAKGILLREFRRGSNPARIFCINFSFDSKLICVSSDHMTIHVFEFSKSTKSLKKMERYLKGDVSFSRLKVSGGNKAEVGICQCAFDRNSDSIIALRTDGSYHNFPFDRTSGKCSQQNYCLFSELNNNK